MEVVVLAVVMAVDEGGDGGVISVEIVDGCVDHIV